MIRAAKKKTLAPARWLLPLAALVSLLLAPAAASASIPSRSDLPASFTGGAAGELASLLPREEPEFRLFDGIWLLPETRIGVFDFEGENLIGAESELTPRARLGCDDAPCGIASGLGLGLELDTDLGWYYVRNRWYDPNTGSFVSADPAGYPDSMNPYVWPVASPWAHDPMGLQEGSKPGFWGQTWSLLLKGLGLGKEDEDPTPTQRELERIRQDAPDILAPGQRVSYDPREGRAVARSMRSELAGGLEIPTTVAATVAVEIVIYYSGEKVAEFAGRVAVRVGGKIRRWFNTPKEAAEYAERIGAKSITWVDEGGATAASRSVAPDRRLLTSGSTYPNAGGFIRSFVTTEERTYYRVFSDRSQGGFLTGVRPKSRAQAIEGLALPPENTAIYIQEVRVPAGVRLQRSRALPANERRGGLEQFQILPGQQDKGITFGPGVPFE